MKKRPFVILSLLIPAAMSLSGCILTDLIFGRKETIVEETRIEVVSELKINLAKETTKQLSPTLSNKSVTDPTYTYSSSNTSVATVSKSGLVTAKAVGYSNITISLDTNPSIKAYIVVKVTNESVSTYDYTIMYYMCASTLEYDETDRNPEQKYFTEDIKEILSVEGMPSNVKILIETGGTKQWFMPSDYLEGATSISSTNLQRWEVHNGKLKLVETLTTNQMAKQSSFTEFLSWGLDEYEATQMGVVISGHGGGVAGCAYDDNYLDSDGYSKTLRTYEVAGAAKAALANSNKDKFTWIGYDCCVMQGADNASINADYFEYMVASQELENATGWNHDYYLPYLKNNTKIAPETFLPKICDGFLLEQHSDSESSREACLQTLSVLDLSKASTFVSAFNSLVNSVGTTQNAYNTLKTAFLNSYNSLGDSCYGLCDFKSYMKALTSYNTSAVTSALSDLVLYESHCSRYTTAPCGLNAFFPLTLDNHTILQVGKADYTGNDATKLRPYQTLCLAYGEFGW